MSKLDFCNMAPKIGFYQEDTVSVMPKYNMNRPASPVFITTDTSGNEIMFFMANDGGYDPQTRMFRAYRTKQTQQFLYDNNICTPGFCNALGIYVTNIITLDNDYAVLGCSNNRVYIVDTVFSYDVSLWTNYKDITSIANLSSLAFNGHATTGQRKIRFFRKWGTIAIFSLVNRNLKNRYDSRTITIYRYSDLTMLKVLYLENEKMYFSSTMLNANYRFFPASSPYHNITNASDISTDWSYSNWGDFQFIMLPEKGIVCVNADATIYGNIFYPSGSNSAAGSSVAICERYNIPEHYYYNNTVGNGAQFNMSQFGFNTAHESYRWAQNISYDSFKRNYYLTSAGDCYINNEVGAFIYSMDDQGDFANCFGFNNKSTVGLNIWLSLTTADASNWAKFLFPSFILWDHIILNSQNKQGNHLTYLNKARYVNGYESNGYLETVPNNYFEISFDEYNKTMLRSDPQGLVFCRQTNNALLLLYCYYDSGNKRLVAEQVTQTVSTGNAIYNRTTYRTLNFDISTKIGTSYGGFTIQYRNCFHNPLGNYWILCYDIVSGTQYIGYPVFYLVNSGGGVTSFNNIWSKYDSYSTSIFESIKNRFSSGSNPGPNYYKTLNVASSLYNVIGFFNPISGLINGQVWTVFTMEFNSSLNNFTCKKAWCSSTYPHSFQNGWFFHHLYYSGALCGFCHGDDRNHQQTVRTFFTQKPLLTSSTAQTYSDTDFIINGKHNTYYFWCRSSTGLRCFVPAIDIFLGGYYSEMTDSVEIPLTANAVNYIYMERPKDSREKVVCFADTRQLIVPGSRQFSRIIIAKLTTDDEGPIDIEYYHVNTGYNDYMFHHNQYYS